MAYQFDKISVLIVEDNAPMQQLLTRILQTFGVRKIYTALNGAEGFDIFCQNNPDLVIADWVMKPTDGLELVRLIRTNLRSPNVFAPVIMTTGFTDKARVESARDSGITEFLVKPFSAEQLYKRIVQCVEVPRVFVKSEGFSGPDRRRARTAAYQGQERRGVE